MKIDSELLKEVSIAALSNAEQYLKDAKILIKNGSYAHGFALAVLADEEISKSYICLMFWFIDKEMDQKTYKEFFVSHKEKLSFLRFNVLWTTASKYLRNTIERRGTEAIYERDLFFESLQKTLQTADSKTRRGNEMREELGQLDNLQDKKLTAMYIGVTKEGEVTTPENIDKAFASNYIRYVKKRFDFYKTIINENLQVPDELRKQFIAILKDAVLKYQENHTGE